MEAIPERVSKLTFLLYRGIVYVGFGWPAFVQSGGASVFRAERFAALQVAEAIRIFRLWTVVATHMIWN